MIKFTIKLIIFYFLDFYQFLFQSNFLNQRNKISLINLMQIELHRIEKGLSLRKVKKDFGYNAIKKLTKFSMDFHKLYGFHDIFFSISDAFREYKNKINPKNENINYYLDLFFFKFKNNNNFTTQNGGTRINKKFNFDSVYIKKFLLNRVSCRNFSKKKIPSEKFIKAKIIAQTSPSVCNRQSCSFVRIKKNRKVIQKFQGGGKGFVSDASDIVAIVSDLRSFTNTYERNQCYFEMGTYALNLVYAFQLQGVSSCYLNWCVSPIKEKKIKKILNLSGHYKIGALLALGYARKDLKVAFSKRY